MRFEYTGSKDAPPILFYDKMTGWALNGPEIERVLNNYDELVASQQQNASKTIAVVPLENGHTVHSEQDLRNACEQLKRQFTYPPPKSQLDVILVTKDVGEAFRTTVETWQYMNTVDLPKTTTNKIHYRGTPIEIFDTTTELLLRCLDLKKQGMHVGIIESRTTNAQIEDLTKAHS
jgi:hypothetical protein